jgi:hypothetical protein
MESSIFNKHKYKYSKKVLEYVREFHREQKILAATANSFHYPAPWHPPAPAGGGKRFLATGKNKTS